jgi:hypothetical protein
MEPVNDEQLPKRRRHQRRALIVDEETQLTVAELADQRQNYHDTMRVLVSYHLIVVELFCIVNKCVIRMRLKTL